MESKVLAEPVLVGRERELNELSHFLELVSEGKGKTVVISAEAGVGKTRLLQEFINSAKQDKNTVILSGWCLFKAGVPYFPFIEAFSSYYSAVNDTSEKEELELNSWLKGPAKTGLSGKLVYLSPQALKDQTFVAVAKTIHSIASQNRVILVVEDIHWADSASLALLHYIARAVKGSERVLVLATFRSEELTHDSEGYPHQLVETLAMMRREDLFDQINLTNLDPVCVIRMAESMLGGTLQQGLAEKLAVKSEGNPLFVVESVRMLHEQENLVRENNEWHLAVEEIEIPSKMRDIIIQRLACLNGVQRRILNAASVIGEEFEVGLLSAAVEQDTLDVLETLNVIANSTALIRVDENRHKFDHARSRETIYETLTQPLREGYHYKIAEILENVKGGQLPVSDLAYHYAQGGNKEKSLKYSLAAAKDELARSSNVQAIKHFQYVLQNITEEHAQEKRTALEGLGDAYVASYLFAEAIKTFDELAAVGTGSVRLRAIRKAMSAAFNKGDKPDLLLEYAKRDESLDTDDRLEMARIRSNKARAIGWAGRGEVKTELSEYDSALTVFEEENSLADVAETLWRSGAVCLFFEDLRKKGLIELLRSAAIFRDIGYVRKEIQATVWTGDGFLCNELISEAEHELHGVLELGEKMDVFGELAGARYYLGIIAERNGRFSEALSHSLKSLEYSDKTDLGFLQGFAYASLTRQYCKLGDLNSADKYFDKMVKLPKEILSQVLLAPMILMSKGVYFAAKGLWEESSQVFRKLSLSVDHSIAKRIENIARPSYFWMLEGQGCFEEARAQRERMKKNLREAEELFEHANVLGSLMVRRQAVVGEEFEMRLDLVNVGRKACTVVKIVGAVSPEFNVIGLPSFCNLQNGSLSLKEKIVDPFKVETIKLKLKATKAGNYNILAEAIFVDDLGETKTSKLNSISLTVKPVSSETKTAKIPELKPGKLKFRSEAADKAFTYLTKAFEEDRLSRKLAEEKSGWRTVMEISRNAHISKYSMYGRHGKGGEATRELRLLDVVESRLFLGERGRGGHVLKMRIRYEKLKQHSDEQ